MTKPDDLETLVHEALTRLSSPHAPRTLLPRVMAAVDHHARRPWYTRAWLTWPPAWQVASTTALVAAVIGLGLLAPQVQTMMTGLLDSGTRLLLSHAAPTIESLRAVADVGAVLWRALVQPIAGYLLILILVMLTACAAAGAALDRLALGGATRS